MGNRKIILAERPVGKPKPSDFRLEEGVAGTPGKGQALVRNLFLSIDPAIRGWMSESRGSYLPPIEIGEPVRSGTLAEIVDSNVPGYEPGDLAYALAAWEETSVVDGKAQLHGKVQPIEGLPLSSHVGLLGGSGLAAYFGLLEVGKPKAGETVVVTAAAGSVGQLVGPLAKLHGCRAIGVAGGAEKCRWIVEALGYDDAIDYRAGDVRRELKRACPDGIDVFFDNVGGEVLDEALSRLNVHARVVISGAMSRLNATEPPPGPRNYLQLVAKRARMEGFVTLDYQDRYGDARRALSAWAREGKIRYRDEILEGLETAPEALDRLFEGKNRGKLMVRLGDPTGSRTRGGR